MKEYLQILKNYNADVNSAEIVSLKEMLQDQGTYLPVFVWFYVVGEIPFLELQQLYFKIKTYRELLRQYKITPLDVYKPKIYDAKKQYELLLDVIDEAISENQKENFARSFISKKYLHLINRASMIILWKLHDELKLDRQKIQNLIFDKLAYYKYDTEFEKALQKTFEMLTQGTWNVEYLKMELRQELIDVVFNDDVILIARLDTYAQCKAVGSRNWCITRNKSMFDMFTKNGTQYIIFNTKKERTTGDAIVGYTAKSTRSSTSYLAYFNLGGVSSNQFDKPYDWKKNLQKYLKYMPCVKELDFTPDNLEEKISNSLVKEVCLDKEIIDKLQNDSLMISECKKIASYQKNALLYAAILLSKKKTIDELLKDKNINVNSDVLGDIYIRPNNMLAAAIKMRDYETIYKIFKHRSCNQATINENYYYVLHETHPNENIFKILKEKYKTFEQLEGVLIKIVNRYWHSDKKEDGMIIKVLKTHQPSQNEVNNYLNKIKHYYNFDNILLAFQSVGYGKNLKTKRSKLLRD